MPGGVHGALEAVDQLRRGDDEAEPQRREQGLGESAEVDDPAGAVEALHGRDRPAAEAVLGVVIVLDDPGIVALGQRKQAQAILHAHDHAQGPLAGRCDEDEAGRPVALGVQIPAAAADIQRLDRSTGTGEGAAGAGISGVLHPDRVARIGQHPCDEVERRLGAAQHDHLIRAALHAPRDAEIVCNGLAQPGMPGDVVVAEEVLARPAGVPRQEPRPGREGEGGGLGIAGMERDLAGIGAVTALARHQLAARREGRMAARRRLAAGGHRFLGQVRHPGARARARLEIALGQQRVVGGDHGVAADAQLLGQGARRRQAAAGAQPPFEDLRPQAGVELAVHRDVTAGLQRQHVERQARPAQHRRLSPRCARRRAASGRRGWHGSPSAPPCARRTSSGGRGRWSACRPSRVRWPWRRAPPARHRR